MNFFEHQRKAKQNTKLLVFLFVLAVCGIIFAVTFFLTVVFHSGDPYDPAMTLNFWQKFMGIAKYSVPLNILLIAGVSMFRVASLGGSGRSVAEYLGAIPLAVNPKDERAVQLRNIVEEMSIASGVPVPDIYVLNDDMGINAFAAGTKASNAAIGVTRGAVEKLSRDELQGVIAHEFSHILNGDMRLNLNLLGIIAGILFLATIGRVLMRSSRRSRSSRNGGGIVILGLGLFVIGYIGVFFGDLIKAAVSRQREFLADASSVQFTRNPLGIGSALNKIKEFSSNVSAPTAGEASHFFFGPIKAFSFFSTHPSIDERVRRLNLVALQFEQTKEKKQSVHSAVQRVGQPGPKDVLIATTILQGITENMRQSLYQAQTAKHTVLALLAHYENDQATLNKLPPKIVQAAASTPEDKILHLVDLALPALHQLNPTEAATFYMSVENYAFKDNHLKPLELALLSILRRHLNLNGTKRSAQASLGSARSSALIVMKMLAFAGANAQPNAGFEAFKSGAQYLSLDTAAIQAAWNDPAPMPRLIDQSLRRLGDLTPDAQEKIFSAFWTVANHDKQITPAEHQTLRAIAEVMEIPLPPTTG